MPNQTFRFRYFKLMAGSAACCVVLVGVGYWPTLNVAGGPGVIAMLVGVSASLMASALGAIPVCSALAGPVDKAPIAILLGTCVRFLVILLLVASLGFTGLVERVPFVVWVAVSYLSLLLLDTLLSTLSLRTLQQGASR